MAGKVDRRAFSSIVRNWTRPTGRKACGRDPFAGPGTCHFWWEGCPKAAERGCFQRHFHDEVKERGLEA